MYSKVTSQTYAHSLIGSVNKIIRAVSSFFSENTIISYSLKQLGLKDYDLPLNNSEDSRFLILLIGLMCFLAVIACSGTFALKNMTDRWSSGLENKVTIEISTETKDGHLLSNSAVQRETKKIAKGLEGNSAVKSVKILSNDEVQELISPWIGSDLTLNDIPLPGLIAIELKDADPDKISSLRESLDQISHYAHLETHHEWLADLIKFTNTLKHLSVFIILIIGSTTTIAIAAGIHTRLAIHKKEVELLHSIGATDNYIARQFQRHAMLLALKGGAVGTIAGLLVAGLVIFLSSKSDTSLIPKLEIGAVSVFVLCTIPVFASMIATVTSRFTVLRSLAKMP